MNEEAVLGQVVEALNTIFNPSSTNEQRRLAHNYCESVKEAPNGPIIGHYLAKNDSGQPDIVRHFGLSALEHGIRFRWAQYSIQEHEQIRNCVVELVQNGTKNILEEPLYIKEKCARLFVEVAKRMWPGQGWDDVDRLLQRLYDSNPTSREIALLILRTLAEDIFVFEDAVAELRKRELCSAMMAAAVSSKLVEEDRKVKYSEGQQADSCDGMQGQPGTTNGNSNNVIAGMSRKLDQELLTNFARMDQDNEGWIARWAKALPGLYEEWCREVQMGNATAAAIAEKLCVATLNAIQMYLDWVWLDSLVETRLIYGIIDLILSNAFSIRLAAVEGLVVLADRHLNAAETLRDVSIIEPILGYGLDTMVAVWARSHGATNLDPGALNMVEQLNPVSEEEYVFVKRFVQAYTLIGQNHICIKKATGASIPPAFDKYLTLMIIIADHPSLLLSSSTMSLFNELLKHDTFKITPEVQAIMPKLLELSIQGISSSIEISQVSKYYKEIDFATTAEYNMYVHSNRLKMKDIVKSIVSLKPVESFQWLYGRIQSTLAIQVDSAQVNEKGIIVPQAPLFRAFESSMNLIDVMVPAVPSELIQGTDATRIAVHQQLLPLMQDAVRTLTLYESNDPTIVRLQMGMILPFALVLRTNRDLLMSTLTKLFTFVSFTILTEANARQQGLPLCEETKVVRIKACTSISKLAVVMADELYTVYGQISEAITGLIQKGLVFEDEQRHLAEARLSIIHYSLLPSDEKKQRLKEVIDPYTQNWASLRISEFATNPINFRKFLGIDVLAANVEHLNRIDGSLEIINPPLYQTLIQETRDRVKVGILVASLISFLRRTIDTRRKSKFPLKRNAREKLTASPPPQHQFWKDYLGAIVPNVLLLIQSVHALWDVRAWEDLPPELSSIKDISRSERLFYVYGTPHKKADDDSPIDAEPSSGIPEELDRQINFVRTWLVHMREHCYHIIALLTYVDTDLYTLPGLPEALTTALFSSASHLDNRHWKALITTVLPPLTLHCPPGNPLLHLVLPPFFEYVTKRLDSEWAIAAAKGGFKPDDEEADEDKMEDVSDEIISERILRDFTRSVSDLIGSIFAASLEKPPPPNPRPIFANEELTDYILSNSTIYTPLLHSLSRLLVYEDTKSARRALNTMIRLVPVLARLAHFALFLGREVLIASLTTLHDGYHADVHNEAVALVADIYVRLRFGQNSTIPYETMLSLPDMTPQRLQLFENELKTKTAPKDQQAVVKLFLQGITGMEISQWFVRKDSFVLSSGPKERVLHPERDSHRSDIVEVSHNADAVGLEALFAS